MLQLNQLRTTGDRIWGLFEAPIAGTPFTLAKMIVVIALVILLVWITGRVTNWVAKGVLRRRGLDAGITDEIATLIRYALITVGLLIILQAVVGVNLSTVAALLGGLGVGIGFGLQNIIGNFFSGLVILFERPVKVGEKVRIGEAVGTVRRIAIRATTLVSDDNTAIIVPNSDFISQRVTNWRYAARSGRVQVKVRTRYDRDPAAVQQLLVATAKAEDWVNDTPEVEAYLLDMSDGWQHFEVRAWARGVDASDQLVSRLNIAIWRALQDAAAKAAEPAPAS